MFNRLYLDTNVLFNSWPSPSTSVRAMFNLARMLEIELAMPLVVELELKRQMKADLEEAVRARDQSLSAISNLLQRFHDQTDVDYGDWFMDEFGSGALMLKYDRASEQAKDRWKIQSVPLTSRDLQHFLERAINRVPPCREVNDDVTGLQDAAILASIREDLDRSPGVLGAFLTLDKRFAQAAAGSSLPVFETLSAVVEALKQDMPSHLRSTLDREESMAKTALLKNERDAEAFIISTIRPREFDGVIADSRDVEKLQGLEMEGIEAVIVGPDDNGQAQSFDASFTIRGQLTYKYRFLGRFSLSRTARVWTELDAKVFCENEEKPSIQFRSARPSHIHREIEDVHRNNAEL
jgi:hypothetical protein